MDPRRDELDLVTELRALRPAPRQEFAAALDARAEAGFPPDPDHGTPPLARLASRLRAVPTRRLLVPAGGFAVAAIVVATAAVAISTGISDDSPRQVADVESSFEDSHPRPKQLSNELPSHTPRTSTPTEAHATSGSSAGGSSGVQDSDAPASAVAPAASAEIEKVTSPGSGPFASQAGHRDVERSSTIVLGADPSEVRADAAKVFETVHAYDGIVLRSSISDGADGEAGATFDLLIPSGKLGDALAAFSRIAEVRSRHEASQDITAPTIHSAERLQDSRAKIEGLLLQLSRADSDAERAAVEVELRAERRRAAALRSSLTGLHRRANLSRVSLRIETGSASPSASGNSSWGIGDALADAGRILAIAAGVTLIGLAILGPLALICAIAWLAHRAWTRQRRERALS